VHPVAGQQHIALGRAAVVEMRDDRVLPIFDRRQALAIRDRHPTAHRLLEQNLLERRTQNGDARSRTADSNPADGTAPLIAEGELARRRARRGDPIGKAEGVQDAHAVGGDLEPAADRCRLRVGFEDLRLDPAALEEERRRGSRDAAADDEGA
jgi:hypothetical protein